MLTVRTISVPALIIGSGLVLGACGGTTPEQPTALSSTANAPVQNTSEPRAPVATMTTVPAAPASQTTAPAVASSSKLNACAILSREEISAAVGEPVSDGKETLHDELHDIVVSHCSFKLTTSGKRLGVQIRYSPREEMPRTVEEFKKTALSEEDKKIADAMQPMQGVGDLALWSQELGTLTVYAKQHYFIGISIVSLSSNPDAKDAERAKAVAQRVVARVP